MMSATVAPSHALATEEHRATRFYRPELDALRFFAFLAVFIFHAFSKTLQADYPTRIPHWIINFLLYIANGGVYGVDLFFALSAYLITTLLLRERETYGDVDVRRFYIRRALRIWPLYFCYLAFCVLLAHIPATEQVLPFRYIAGYCLMVGNWTFVFYGLTTFASVSAVLWTVSVEEQFYLLWPLAMRRASVRRMAGIAIGILIVDNLYRIIGTIRRSDFAAASTFARIDPIALGILLALFIDKIPALSRWQRVALLLFGLGSWPLLYLFFSQNSRIVLNYPLAAISAAAILLSFLGSQHALLRNKALLYLGKISYGLYIFHLFALWYTARILHPKNPLAIILARGLALALTILLAAVSYRWLESPFLKLKERLSYVPSRPV